jgi:hypothetical protein
MDHPHLHFCSYIEIRYLIYYIHKSNVDIKVGLSDNLGVCPDPPEVWASISHLSSVF